MGTGKVCVLRMCTGTSACWLYTEGCIVDEAWDECMEVCRACGSRLCGQMLGEGVFT